MAELKVLGTNLVDFLKKPAVSHALLALALKSHYTAGAATLLAAALGLQ